MRRLSFYVMTLVLLVSAAGLAACDDTSESPGTDPTPTGQAQPAEREYDLDETASAAARLLGGEGTAAYAVLQASDNGYSPYQVAQAIDAGTIDESGAIEGVTPASPAGSTTSSDSGAARLRVASVALAGSLPALFADTDDSLPDRTDIEQTFAELRDEREAGRWLVWLLGATGAGYSAGQITQYLDENQPLADHWPPALSGVPIVVDSDGDMLEPELPSDWPYEGRNILRGLQRDGDPSFDGSWAVLVIGMVNAGYSSQQISDALEKGSIGLCSTQGDSSDADAALSPCYIESGAIVPPAQTTPYSPAEILVEDIVPIWPIERVAARVLAAGGGGQDGLRVSLELTPFLATATTSLEITSHRVVMELEPTAEGTGLMVEGSWRIELIETETDEDHEKGEKYVLEGQFFTGENESIRLGPNAFGLQTTSFATFYQADGQHGWERTEQVTEADLERVMAGGAGFSGWLDENLEGWGGFGEIGGIAMRWKHPSDYEPHPDPSPESSTP